MRKEPIKVLLVDDSKIALVIYKRVLDAVPDIEVVGVAHSGRAALELIPKLQPNVICTDLHMPDIDGLELTKIVMEKFPKPILVSSVSVQKQGDEHNIFALLQAGAIDICAKPIDGVNDENQEFTQELVRKIRILSGVVPITKRRRETKTETAGISVSKPMPIVQTSLQTIKMVAIGASTGGPQALLEILAPLSANFPVPIVCVQHISEGFLSGLIEWLNNHCSLRVKIAEKGELPCAGTIYFPAERQHLVLDDKGLFEVNRDEPVGGHRPSITTTFLSLAEHYRGNLLGIILTGMGRDGADGLKKIYDYGGVTIAQDEATSVVYGMPKAASDLGAARYLLGIKEIYPAILKIVGI